MVRVHGKHTWHVHTVNVHTTRAHRTYTRQTYGTYTRNAHGTHRVRAHGTYTVSAHGTRTRQTHTRRKDTSTRSKRTRGISAHESYTVYVHATITHRECPGGVLWYPFFVVGPVWRTIDDPDGPGSTSTHGGSRGPSRTRTSDDTGAPVGVSLCLRLLRAGTCGPRRGRRRVNGHREGGNKRTGGPFV